MAWGHWLAGIRWGPFVRSKHTTFQIMFILNFKAMKTYQRQSKIHKIHMRVQVDLKVCGHEHTGLNWQL